MKALLITLALLAPANGRSLGIGVDVLPEAYTFAAHRVGFAADLRLTTCTTTTCVWDLGDGVTIEAAWPQGSLDIDRIEATLGAPADDADPAAHRFDKACLAIVALVDRDASAADVRAAGKVIASASGDAASPVQIHLPGRWVSVYGLTAAASGGTRSAARRCGATAGL